MCSLSSIPLAPSRSRPDSEVVPLVDYSGPSRTLPPERAARLDARRWAWQPKLDGVFVRLSTDRAGRISSLLYRSGEHVRPTDADGLVGLAIGLPDAVLHGELEAQTERGIAARSARGWAAFHLFDAARVYGRPVTALPYSERYGWLHRWQSAAECGDLPRCDWWTEDVTGRAHDATGRFVRPVPRDLRRLPIVPLHRGPGAFDEIWSQVETGALEGVVSVNLESHLGVRSAKIRTKPLQTLDCVVVSIGARRTAATLVYVDGSSRREFSCSFTSKAAQSADVGDIVEVAYEQIDRRGPRHARVVRVRSDLGASAVC